jgi:hypothetical protein
MNITDFKSNQERLSKDPKNWIGVYNLKEYAAPEFDHLRQMWCDARSAYNSTLEIIGQIAGIIREKYTAERDSKRESLTYTFRLDKRVDELERTVYTIVAVPDYVMETDSDYYKERKYSPFMVIEDVVVFTHTGGWQWNGLNNGHVLSVNDRMHLQDGKIPQFFIQRLQKSHQSQLAV